MVGGNFIAVLAGAAALVVAPVASAQNGFPDYRQAAADQYPAQPPPADSGSGGGESQTGGSSGNARPVQASHVHKSTPSRHTTGKNTNANAGGGGSAPVAVPTTPAPSANGSLPFTGSDLSGLVVLALILIATGLLLAAASRATRRRRRRAPA